MSDKELEEYINKIEPNFDSHLEKGTIEMSNEYYNLLEEKMARLINKNQELKEQVDYLRRSIERKEVIDKAIEYIRIYRSYEKINNKDYLKGRDETGCLDINQVDELLDILKEVNK